MGIVLNQFLYDFKRSTKSKTVLIILGLIMLASLAILPLTSISIQPQFGSGIFFSYYKKDSSYEILLFLHDAFGDPLKNYQINLDVSEVIGGTTNFISSYKLTTDSSGYARISLDLKPNSTYSVEINSFISEGLEPRSFTISTSTNGETFKVRPVMDPSNSSRYNLLVFYVGLGGEKPNNYKVYIDPLGPEAGGIKETFLGELNDYAKVFKLDPSLFNVPQFPARITIKDTNDMVISTLITPVIVEAPLIPITVNQIVFLFISGILVTFIPLMVILAAYNLYGKDKITGVLDFIISMPITRTILGLSRYLSIISTVVLAIGISLALADLLLYYRIGETFSLEYWFIALIGLTVAASALLGIILSLSNVLRSTGALLGVSIVIWLIFVLLWDLITFLVALAFNIQVSSRDFITLSVTLSYFNPVKYFELLYTYMTNSYFVGFGPESISIPIAELVDLRSLIIAGIAWVVMPFLTFIFLLRTRD